MNISLNEKNENDSQKNALLIRVKIKLPQSVKAKLKQSGAIWLDAHQGYAIPIQQKHSVEALLEPWKLQIEISEIFIDNQKEDLLTSNSEASPFMLDENGLWRVEEGGKTWIASPIHITARIRDENGLNHGKLIEFDDSDGIHHTWPMPMEMLASDCTEFRSTLMNAGLEISTFPRARQWLADYVQHSSPSLRPASVTKMA